MNIKTFHTKAITQTLSLWFVRQVAPQILTPVRQATITFLLLAHMGYAQLADSFADGDFTQNPAWTGDIVKFTVNSAKLKLQAPVVADNAFLSTPSQAIHNGSWEFYLQMDFTPSSTNYAKIYLVSDQANLSTALNGYFVKAGNTAREISLYRQNGSVETKIIDGTDDRINQAVVKVKIKVTRNASGNWQLFSDVGPTGNYVSEGSVIDINQTASAYFGVQCTYTSTRSDKFWFDDFLVSGFTVPDTTPPYVLSSTTVGQSQINIKFSEPVDGATAQAVGNYSIANFAGIRSVDLQADQQTVVAMLSSALVNGVTYSLKISGVKDLAGNQMNPSTNAINFFQAGPTHFKDLIFTEVFPDPTPQVGLPAAEFVEIFNRSPAPFNLAGWKLSDGSSTAVFGSQIILPGEYLIVAASAAVFSSFGRVVSLSNFPTLNNENDKIVLKDADSHTIDSINYFTSWYRNDDKKEGGWSLELIDPGNTCGDEDNWMASEDPRGGTPGRQNSVFANKPDLTPPQIIELFPESSRRLIAIFNEKLEYPLPGGDFKLDPPIAINGISFADPALRSLYISLSSDMVMKQPYSLTVTGVRDCAGNAMSPKQFDFGLPEKAVWRDAIVNELLFNPRPGGIDFVEIYNRSEKYIDLKDWKLGNFEHGIVTNQEIMFNSNQLIAPHSFAVFTINPEIILLQYPSGISSCLFKASIPSLPDDEGSVALVDDVGGLIDHVNYFKEWHSPFIKDDEGVSLERIDPGAESDDPANWNSASGAVGYATPGFWNSQFRTPVTGQGDVFVTPEIFSPGSGSNEFVRINYQFEQAGWIATVAVFDQQGHKLKSIANNELLGASGFFRWDGDRDDGVKARLGYYVVQFEVFDASGTFRRYLRRMVLASP
jgi:hypothetical protein